MQTAPTGGAPGTGVSEAKVKPSPGRVEPVAGPDASSPAKSSQQRVIADAVSRNDVAAANLLAAAQLLPSLSASDAIAVLQANGMQITSAGNGVAVGVSDAKLDPSQGRSAPANASGGIIPAKSLPQVPLGDVGNVPAIAMGDLLKLARILQPVNPLERTLRVDSLIRETVSAIRENRIEFAVGRLIEAATVDPARVDEIRSMVEFEPIRSNVEHVVAHLSNVARIDAETKLTSAEQLFEDVGYQKLAHWETAPADLLRIGHRLIEAGGYLNYVRTAELAATLQSAYWAATSVDSRLVNDTADKLKKEEAALRRNGARPTTLALVRHTWNALRKELPRGVRVAWTRAPLLVLFGVWFTLGLAGGVLSKLARILSPESWMVAASNFGFEVWALGFLLLAGLSFWAGVRKRST